MGAGTVYEELDEAKANIENLQANYKIKLELSESLKRSYNEQLIKNQEAALKIDKLSQQVNEKDALLEEVKAENEKLRENYQTKVEYSENLRRAHNEQLNKNQEAVSKIEKLSQELHEKIEEISLAREKYEEIELRFKEKDALVKHLTSLNDKLRAESKDKITKYEDENLRLGLALEEANAKNMQQEQLMKSFQDEINWFKGHASVSKSSCSETDSKSFKEMSQRDDMLQKTEEEKYKYENQLKWKKEQFNHLQEAHEKLRSDFRVKEREWEKEKASLLDELSILQTKLDSQIRLSESLKSRLEMCNNALSHAESKRKLLEAELSETKSNFGNVYAEFEEAKSTIEHLTGERDKEIARLRCSLGEKENLYKEMEYQVKMLEHEKEDLISSLKELQETQIQGGENPSSLPKLRNKLKSLEQVLKAKESDWNSQMETLLEKLNCYSMELNSKTELIDKLKIEIETRDFMILEQGLHNEEIAITLLALKSELSDVKLKFSDPYAPDVAQNDKEIASLRCSLAEKENLYKQMEYQVRMLEHEKKNLISSFKAIQETHIQGGGDSSSSEKLEGLEQEHKDCSERLKAKESDWTSQMETLVEKLNHCSTELDSKTDLIDKLKIEAESRDSVILEQALHIEEVAIMLLVLKSELSAAKLKFADVYAADLAQNDNEHKERFAALIKLLDGKSFALVEAQKLAEVERMKVAELTEKIASANLLTEDCELSLVKEIERLKQELSESNALCCELKNQNLTVENALNEVRNTLWRTNEELDVKFCESIELDFQLQVWKSIGQQLKTKLEDDHLINRSDVEASVHSQIRSLKNHVKKLRFAIAKANEELAEKFCEGNETEFQLQIWKSIAEQLNKKLEENHHLRREVEASLLAQTGLEVNLKQEKVHFLSLLEEKDKKIHTLEQELVSLSKTPECNTLQKEIPHHEEEEWMKRELERAILVQVDAERKYETLQQQVEEKDQRIENLQHIVKSLEQDIHKSTASFSSKLSEMQLQINSFHQAWDEVAATLIMKEMEIQEKNLILIEMENVLKLSSNRLNELCDEDMQLTKRLDCIMQAFDHEEMDELDMKFVDGGGDFDPVKENRNMVSTPKSSSSKHDGILDQRCPFKAINN